MQQLKNATGLNQVLSLINHFTGLLKIASEHLRREAEQDDQLKGKLYI